jgi:hypothetical protein
MESRFDERELKEKGAKRAVLDYIAGQDSSIPIPRTVELEDKEGIIVRSDGWREFDSFYGIFESVVLHKPYPAHKNFVPNLDKARKFMLMEEVGEDREVGWNVERRKKLFEYYCKARDLNPTEVLSEMKFFPQEYIDSRARGTIFEHPNVCDRYFLFAGKSEWLPTDAIVFDVHEREIKLVNAFVGTSEVDVKRFFEEREVITKERVEEIAGLYRHITQMDKFQDGFDYMMEFTSDPTFVLQLRRFRKFQDGSNVECAWGSDSDVARTDISLGVTPSEGLVLPFITGKSMSSCLYPDEVTQPMYDFNGEHPRGFAMTSASGHYLTTFFPNLKAVLGIDPAKTANHGTLETLSTVPIFLFNGKRIIREKGIDVGSEYEAGNLKIFSNGREGFIKVLDRKVLPYDLMELCEKAYGHLRRT